MKDQKYVIIIDSNITLLEQKVNDYIKLGYIPIGGITIDNWKYCQIVYNPN